MESRNPQDFTVAELKSKLRALGLTTTGAKSELITRLLLADPSGNWMDNNMAENHQDSACAPEGDDDSGMARRSISDEDDRTKADADREMLRREKELAERELALARREIELLRQMQQLSVAQPTQAVAAQAVAAQAVTAQATESTSMRIASIMEMLAHFDGTSNAYENWENQLLWLKGAYNLSERDTKNLIVARLRGRAIDWFHSRSEHIALPCKELLDRIRGMFHDEEEKADRRIKFQERMWRKDETFKEYFHEKVILANRVPIDEEEMVMNLIRGIPDSDLRDQARMHCYATKELLLKALEAVPWRSKVNSGVDTRRTSEKSRKENRDKSVTKTDSSQKRCKSCGSRNHLLADCPTKHKGPKCYECRDFGHLSSACPKKKQQGAAVRDGCAASGFGGGKYYKDVAINETKLSALIDTGSDLSLMRASKYVEIGAPNF